MKTRLTTILAAALAVQLALALGLTLSGGDNAAFKAQEPLLAFDPGKIDKIAIDETGGRSVTLTKQGGNWRIAEFADFPASDVKVKTLLEKLAGLKKGWPVATTASAAERFKVTDKNYERRILLISNGQEAGKILLGASPSFRQAHARTGGGDDIYSVAFAIYEASGRGEEWMDRSFLATPEDKIASIAFPDFTLERKDGKFILTGLAENEKQAEAAVSKLARAVAYPAFDAVQGKGDEALAKLNEPDIQFTLKLTDGKETTYKYKKEAQGGAYLFASSAHPFLFRVGETAMEALVNAKREKLLEKPKEPEKTPQAVTKDGHDGEEAGKSGG